MSHSPTIQTDVKVRNAFAEHTVVKPKTSPPKKPKRKRPAPLSLRLSVQERAWLEERAGELPLSTYVRNCALSPDAAPRTTRGKHPVKDYEALAKVLGMMASLNLFGDIKDMLKASDTGTLHLPEEQEQALLVACADISVMRHHLIHALGVKAE